MVENSVGFLRQVVGAKRLKDLSLLANREIFPAGVPDELLDQLEKRESILSMFERFRARLRFEASPSGAACQPFYRESRSFSQRIGFGDSGLAMPGEIEHAIPGLRLQKELREQLFVHVQLLRSLLGMPVCFVVFKMGAFDPDAVRQLGLRIWIAPVQPALLAAPRSIDFADISRHMVLTYNPGIAVELLEQIAHERAELWAQPETVDLDMPPVDKGLPLALFFEPEGQIESVPYERAAIVYRPGEMPRHALALHNPVSDIRLVEHTKGATYETTSIAFFKASPGLPVAEAIAKDLVREAGDDPREAYLGLRELSSHPCISPSAVDVVCQELAKLQAPGDKFESLLHGSGSARLYEVDGHRYREASHVYHRAGAGKSTQPITNFSLRILCDQLDGDGALAARLLRLTMDGAFADFELPALEFDDPKRLWAAICSVAVREGFPSYPSISSNRDKSRLPMIICALQEPAPQTRRGVSLGFQDGTEFNTPDFTVTSTRIIARTNLPADTLRVVGKLPPSAPDLVEMACSFRSWISSLDARALDSAAPVVAAVIWWLYRARGGAGALLTVESRRQIDLIAAMIGLPVVGRGRATRKDAGFPKLLGAEVRTCAQMEAHGDVVVGIADHGHRMDPAIAMLVHDAGTMPTIPENGWLALFARAALDSDTPVDAMLQLSKCCGLDPETTATLGNGISIIVPPYAYAESFFDTCHRCSDDDLVVVSRGRRFLPVSAVEDLAQHGYQFRRRRITKELQRNTPLTQPYFLGRNKLHTWQIPDSVELGRPDIPTANRRESQRGLKGRAAAAYRIGTIHGHLEWTHPRTLLKEVRERPELRKSYVSWLTPTVERRRRLSDSEARAYRSGYSVTAMNCISRTMPLDYVAPFDARFITGNLELDLDQRLALFLTENIARDIDVNDIGFERFKLARSILEEGGIEPEPSILLSNPFSPIKILRT